MIYYISMIPQVFIGKEKFEFANWHEISWIYLATCLCKAPPVATPLEPLHAASQSCLRSGTPLAVNFARGPRGMYTSSISVMPSRVAQATPAINHFDIGRGGVAYALGFPESAVEFSLVRAWIELPGNRATERYPSSAERLTAANRPWLLFSAHTSYTSFISYSFLYAPSLYSGTSIIRMIELWK